MRRGAALLAVFTIGVPGPPEVHRLTARSLFLGLRIVTDWSTPPAPRGPGSAIWRANRASA